MSLRLLFVAFLFTFAAGQAIAQHDVAPTDHFSITGKVKNKLVVTAAQLQAMPQVDLGEVEVKNHRGEKKGSADKMKGVLLKTLLDSAGTLADKPKELSEYYYVFVASDGYKNVYSWNELFNTEIGDKVYIVTSMGDKDLKDMKQRILVISNGDTNTGRRYLRGLDRIEVRRVE